MSGCSVTAHYYVSLCYRALKRLGFAGPESTGEDSARADQLSEMGGDFQFAAPVAGGPVFTLVYQIPGYLDPERGEMPGIWAGVKDLIVSGTTDHLVAEFPGRTRGWDQWFTGPWLNSVLGPIRGKERAVCDLLDRFAEYLDDLWPGYSEAYSTWRDGFPFTRVEERLRLPEVIRSWERVMGRPYPCAGFSMVMCPESPTLASSIGPDKIVFGARHSISLARRSAVHETGVRMPGLHSLAEHPATAPIMHDDYAGLIRVVEAESCCRKPEVFEDLGQDYDVADDLFVRGMNLEGIMETRPEVSPGTSLYEMLALWYRECRRKGLL